LILAAGIPILLFGGWVTYQSATQARDAARLDASEIAMRVAERVEAELAAQLQIAGALATSTALDRPDLAAFYVEAQRLKAAHPLWYTIELTDPSGNQIVNLLRPAGDPLGPTVDRDSFDRVVRTKQPAVGGIGPVGPISGIRLVALRVPVIREGELRYVLSVALAPAGISAILRAAGAPWSWIGAIVDARGNIIARTQAEEREQGRPASPTLREAVDRAPAGGFYEGPTLEGIDTETVFRVLPRTGGWSVHLGVPKETLDGPVRRSIYVLVADSLASLALAAGLAMLTARNIAQRRHAEALRSAKALQASEERGALALEAAELGTWRWDIERELVTGSARCRALLGLPAGASGEDAGGAWPVRRVLKAVLASDRAALMAAVHACLREDLPLDIEFRVGTPDSGVRWLRLAGRAQRQEIGPAPGVHGVIADVSPRKRAEAERVILMLRLTQAQEDVQRRIARELHDQVGQTVTGLSLGLKGLERALGEEGQREQVRWLQGLTSEIGRDIHRAAADLRPTALDDLGLLKALQAYCSDWSERYGVTADVQAIGGGWEDERLPMEVETVLYRIVQEALTNVLKHAEARNVSVVIERKDGLTRLIVEDDGQGLDQGVLPDTGAGDGTGRQRLGLLGIRERLSLTGGTLTVESAPGAGTTLFVQVPSTAMGRLA
jgi:signal transduction histidine kinase